MERKFEDPAADLQLRRVGGKECHRHDRVEEREREGIVNHSGGWVGSTICSPAHTDSNRAASHIERSKPRPRGRNTYRSSSSTSRFSFGDTVARPHDGDSKSSAMLCRCSSTMTLRFSSSSPTRPMPCRRGTSARRSCERPQGRRHAGVQVDPPSRRRCSPSSAPSAHDAVLGEEIGPQPGTSSRRWIFDGIDGTHNYADGRPGWGTIIALEVDGEIVVGLVSAPLSGRRWWAVRGEGAWSAPYAADGSFDAAAAEPLRCGVRTSLADASVIVIPWEGRCSAGATRCRGCSPRPTRRAASASRSTRRWSPTGRSTRRSSCSAGSGTSPPRA